MKRENVIREKRALELNMIKWWLIDAKEIFFLWWKLYVIFVFFRLSIINFLKWWLIMSLEEIFTDVSHNQFIGNQ